MQQDKKLQT